MTATDTVTSSITGTAAIAVTASTPPAITSGTPPPGTVASPYGSTSTEYLRCTSFPLRPGCTPCVPNTAAGCGASLPFCGRQAFAPVCIQKDVFVGFELTGTGGIPAYKWTLIISPTWAGNQYQHRKGADQRHTDSWDGGNLQRDGYAERFRIAARADDSDLLNRYQQSAASSRQQHIFVSRRYGKSAVWLYVLGNRRTAAIPELEGNGDAACGHCTAHKCGRTCRHTDGDGGVSNQRDGGRYAGATLCRTRIQFSRFMRTGSEPRERWEPLVRSRLRPCWRTERCW